MELYDLIWIKVYEKFTKRGKYYSNLDLKKSKRLNTKAQNRYNRLRKYFFLVLYIYFFHLQRALILRNFVFFAQNESKTLV